MDTFWALFCVWLLTLARYAVARHEAEACRDNADFWRRLAIGACESNLAALKRMRSLNPHGWLLDETVWVKKYEGSRWEEAVVVAVSHKGAVAVRRVGEKHTFWIRKDTVRFRVRLERPEED